MEQGIIVKSLAGFYYVKCGGKIICCRAKGGFRNKKETPYVGDRVDIRLIPGEANEGYVEKIHPRKNKITRPPVANIDRLIIVSALTSPEPDTLFIDKLTVLCEKNGIEPVICFNKSDLTANRDIVAEYEKTGYRIFETSVYENIGIEALKEAACEGITAVAGFSGVGKSSLLNSMASEDLSRTGNISERLSRGKHTTRHVELFEIGNNKYIADTPGFSGLTVEELKKEELPYLFPEFVKHISECRFNDCVHMEESECGIKKAVSEGIISASRYASYREFYNILKDINDWERR